MVEDDAHGGVSRGRPRRAPLAALAQQKKVGPFTPQEFSEAWILVPTGTLAALFFGFTAIYQVAVIGEPWPSEENDQLRHLLSMGLTVFFAFMALYGALRRHRVDEDAVTKRFLSISEHRVRFDRVSSVRLGMDGIVVSDGTSRTTLQTGRFDYTLARVRLLEELVSRPFRVERRDPSDPRWEREAEFLCGVLLGALREDHPARFMTDDGLKRWAREISAQPIGRGEVPTRPVLLDP